MTKKQKKILAGLVLREEPEEVKNPFTEVSITLEPQAVALYDLVKGAEAIGNNDIFYDALNLFRELYPSEYMDLLD